MKYKGILSIEINTVRFTIIAAMLPKIHTFWEIMPLQLVNTDKCFEGYQCLYLWHPAVQEQSLFLDCNNMEVK